jgi:hypothetical protein
VTWDIIIRVKKVLAAIIITTDIKDTRGSGVKSVSIKAGLGPSILPTYGIKVVIAVKTPIKRENLIPAKNKATPARVPITVQLKS